MKNQNTGLSAVQKGLAIHSELEKKLAEAPTNYLEREQVVIRHLEEQFGLLQEFTGMDLATEHDSTAQMLVYDPDLNTAEFVNNNPVAFINPGHLDPKAFQIFGLSAKPGSTNPIGQFGTGLKYAIAVCLRHGCSINIALHSAPGQPNDTVRNFSFTASPADFRGKETTEIICTEDTSAGDKTSFTLPFTIDLGKHWELWQAFRELESNVRDEGGESGIGLRIQHSSPHTVITVEGAAFREVYNNRYEYFLHPSFYTESRSFTEGRVLDEITDGFYYKGVRVFTSDNHFLFTYDINAKICLTEDRTIASIYSLRSAMAMFWLTCDDPDLIFRAITAPKGMEEHNIDFEACPFGSHRSPSPAFKEAVHRALSAKPLALNLTARKAVQVDVLDERFVKPFELDNLQKQRLHRSLKFLTDLGYDVRRYPIKLVDISDEIAGMAKSETIVLTRLAFASTTLYLASTILEEYFHLRYQYCDHTPSFQDFLHDEILRMGERVLGEPL